MNITSNYFLQPYTMKDIEEVFGRIKKTKKDQKEIRAMYKDALANNQEYQRIKEKLEKLRNEKKAIEEVTQEQMGRDWNDYETMKEDLKYDNELLSSLAVEYLMNGKPLALKDNEVDYEPIISVRFKRL